MLTIFTILIPPNPDLSIIISHILGNCNSRTKNFSLNVQQTEQIRLPSGKKIKIGQAMHYSGEAACVKGAVLGFVYCKA